MHSRVILPLLSVLLAAHTSAAIPFHQWTQHYGGSQSDEGSATAFDANGHVVVVGTTNQYAFVAKYDANGTQQWFESLGQGRAFDVAIDPANNILITGAFGIYPLEAANPQTSIFVLKLDPNGVQQWVRTFGTPGGTYDEGIAIANNAAGDVFVTGRFLATVDFGGGPLTSAGYEDIFIAKFSSDGSHFWSRRAGSATYREYGSGITVDGAGNVVVIGTNNGPVDMGGGALPYHGSLDIFLAKYAGDGTHLWSHSYGGTGFDDGSAVACDGSNNILLLGRFGGSVNFGGGVLVSAGEGDVVLAKYDPSGTHQWSKRFGSIYYSSGSGLAIDPSDNIFIAGSFPGTIDFGGGPLTTGQPYSSDIFVTKFNTAGDHLWSNRFGDIDYDGAAGLATDANGDIAMTGFFVGSVDFGGGAVTSAGSEDMFLTKFAADGPVPVLISSFDATSDGAGVHLRWKLASDETIGFTLYRRDTPSGPMRSITHLPSDASKYIDGSVQPGAKYDYQLGVETSGGEMILSQTLTVVIPALGVTLGQNHPNPFNPVTSIEYTVAKRSAIVIGIYDSSGALVARLDEGVREAGTHHVQWEGRNSAGQLVASGTYFYRLEGSRAEARKMVLIK